MKAVGLTPYDPPHLLPIKRILESREDKIVQEFTERANDFLDGVNDNAKRACKGEDEERGVIVSMLQDVFNNKEIEVEETFGYLMNTARSKNVDVPTLRVIYSLLRGLNRQIINHFDR